MALHGMVGALIGQSFVPGLSDHFSHCDRNCTPSKIARNLYVSDSVDEIHLVGASGACILRQEVDCEVLRGIRPTFAILEFGTCDLANGTDALPVADAVMNAAAVPDQGCAGPVAYIIRGAPSPQTCNICHFNGCKRDSGCKKIMKEGIGWQF